jgi:hypothetical protein
MRFCTTNCFAAVTPAPGGIRSAKKGRFHLGHPTNLRPRPCQPLRSRAVLVTVPSMCTLRSAVLTLPRTPPYAKAARVALSERHRDSGRSCSAARLSKSATLSVELAPRWYLRSQADTMKAQNLVFGGGTTGRTSCSAVCWKSPRPAYPERRHCGTCPASRVQYPRCAPSRWNQSSRRTGAYPNPTSYFF